MAIVVLDVGKTLTKLSLWSEGGDVIGRRTYANARAQGPAPLALDAGGIEHWLEEALRAFAREAEIRAIVPVAHGAAAAVVRNGAVVGAPLDYECALPDAERARYEALRDGFAVTGSPALPGGLNLGAQLFHLERTAPEVLTGDAVILPWPQYWAWRLSGVVACEVTSLGCHSDLWRPFEQRFSDLAIRRGWAQRFAPLRKAGDVLGPILPRWAERTGLPAATRVYCGIHDSNAALLAARRPDASGEHECTVLSTGTWFVGMRTVGPQAPQPSLGEGRDCLVNVDAHGHPVPSARFMGGREIEVLTGAEAHAGAGGPPALLAAAERVVARDAMALPTFAPGCGPYPGTTGRWMARPDTAPERRAAALLYAALVADAALDLIGARERIVIEGRFAGAELLTGALAALRPDAETCACAADTDVGYGALRLVLPQLGPAAPPARVAPLPVDLAAYRQRWRERAAAAEAA